MPRPEERGQGFRAHALEVADLRVSVAERARALGRSLCWVPEPGCWERFRGTGGEELLKPDAYIEVTTPTATRIAWIELDRGTQSVPTTIQAKVRRYCRAALARAAGRRDVPIVRFVIESSRRAARVRELSPAWGRAEGIGPADTHRLVNVADMDQTVEELLR
jgi:hypothetical protein